MTSALHEGCARHRGSGPQAAAEALELEAVARVTSSSCDDGARRSSAGSDATPHVGRYGWSFREGLLLAEGGGRCSVA